MTWVFEENKNCSEDLLNMMDKEENEQPIADACGVGYGEGRR